jgi:cell wall-associated NlpC family hydrolase
MINIVYESMLKFYCKKLIGKPYIWGGKGGNGFDCSGFVIEVLQATGFLPNGDWTSQGLLERFSKLGWEKVRKEEIKGAEVCFWGKEKATHCSVALDDRFMVEAGGGNSKCTSASNTTGMVRIRPLGWRTDFLAAYRLPVVPPFAPHPPSKPSV